MSASEIDVPTAFIQLCKGLNAYSFLASDAMSGVVREAVKYIDINDRDMVRAFIDEILIETTSDVKLQNLIRECGARIWISEPSGARIVLSMLRDSL